jgi:predicted outer membrane repeat protein
LLKRRKRPVRSRRPGQAPALGLRAGIAGVVILAQTGFRKEKQHVVLFLAAKPDVQPSPPRLRARHRPTPPRFRPQLEVLEERDVPSTLTVTNNLDGSAGSLRYEIAAAQSGDTIVFAPSLKGQTITLNPYFGELAINKNVTIEGPGAKNLAISGGGQSRVFDVAPNVQVALSGMTIENGSNYTGNQAWDSGNQSDGSGILNYGTLALSGCTVSGNVTIGNGGGIANELGGTMTASGCKVSSNSADNGGGIYNDGTMTLSGSSVTKNGAVYGGGIFNEESGNLTIHSSTVTGNNATYGDNLWNYGTLSIDSSSKIGKN